MIEKRKQKPSIHLIRGIAVHSAIEKFYTYQLHKCANMDYAELKQSVIRLLKDEWDHQKENIAACRLAPGDIDFLFDESSRMVIHFLHRFLKDRGFEKPAPTMEKTLFSKKHMLLGRIDAIYKDKNVPVVLDFKTSKSMEMTDDYKRQLAIYALLYDEHFKSVPIVAIHFLKFKDGLKRFKVSREALTRIGNLAGNIHESTTSTDIRDYPCTCGWCDKNFILTPRNNDPSHR